MKDKKIRTLISKSTEIQVDGNRKRQAITYLMEKARQTDFAPSVSLKEVFLNQLYYMSKSCFLLQLLITAAGIYPLAAYGDARQQRIWMQLAGIMPLLVIVSCTEIQKSFMDRMWELESACRYDLRTIVSVRLMILSGGNLFILTVFSVFGSHQTQAGFFRTAIYLLVPFLLMSLFFFTLIRKTKLSRLGLYTAGLAVTLLCLFLSGTELSFVYESGFFAVWLVVFAITVGFLAVSVRHFMKSIKEDTVLWSSR